jgi:PGF-pre-PGF domain-containing protein
MKGKDKKLATVLLAATVLAALASPMPVVAEEAEVVRCLSPLQEDEFEVTLTISGIQPQIVEGISRTVMGINETIPDGFTFPVYPTDYQYYEVSGQKIAFTILEIDEMEIKYKVVAPSSDIGTFSGFWEDFLNEINGTVQDADSDEEEEDDDDDEEEEDLGTTPTPTPSSNVTRVSIEAGEEASLTFEGSDLDVSKIRIKVDKSVSGVEIVVQETEKPENIPDASGIPYSYFNITATNLTANMTAKIEFKVNKSWISGNNINETTIILNRYDGNWTVLPTSKLSEDDIFFYFEAETSVFSLFAISGEKKGGASPTPTHEFGETPTPVATPEPEEGASVSTPTPTSHALPAKTSAKGRDTGLTTIKVVIAASIAVVALVTFAVFRSRMKGGKKE